jgi:hypothetical protein
MDFCLQSSTQSLLTCIKTAGGDGSSLACSSNGDGVATLCDLPLGAQGIHTDLFLLDTATPTAGWPRSWPFLILSNFSSTGNLADSMVWLFPSFLFAPLCTSLASTPTCLLV